MRHSRAILAFFGCVMLIIGLPVFIVFTLRWRNSADFESNSTSTECRVVKRKTIMTCKREDGDYLGTQWGYNVEVRFCNNKILYRGDDECNYSAIPVGEVRPCRVHDNCDSFKWNHATEKNKNSSFVGAGFLGVSFVLFAVAFYCHLRKKKVVPPTTTRQTPHQTSNPDDVELEIKSDPEIIEPEQPTKGCPDDMDSVV